VTAEPNRRVARVAVVDSGGRVLLLPDTDPEWGGYWYLPGGHIEEDEMPEEAARREVFEETGLHVDVGPLLQRHRARFVYGGRELDQEEWHFVARVPEGVQVVARERDNERAAIEAHRWWSLEELRATSQAVYPGGLDVIIQPWLVGDGQHG
jgi:8-oxo-dGTP pyrophosphatase MutT (NUDIX family)